MPLALIPLPPLPLADELSGPPAASRVTLFSLTAHPPPVLQPSPFAGKLSWAQPQGPVLLALPKLMPLRLSVESPCPLADELTGPPLALPSCTPPLLRLPPSSA